MSDLGKIVLIPPGVTGKIFSSRGVEDLFFDSPACGMVISVKNVSLGRFGGYDILVDGELVELKRESFAYVKNHK